MPPDAPPESNPTTAFTGRLADPAYLQELVDEGDALAEATWPRDPDLSFAEEMEFRDNADRTLGLWWVKEQARKRLWATLATEDLIDLASDVARWMRDREREPMDYAHPDLGLSQSDFLPGRLQAWSQSGRNTAAFHRIVSAGNVRGDYITESSWRPVDMKAVLAGDISPLKATRWQRVDGVRMLYPGRTHNFHGVRESLKSFAAKVVVAEVLNDGGTCLYLDFDSEASDVVGQLRLLGVDDEALTSRLLYVRPDDPMTSEHLSALLAALPPHLDLTVVDGVDFGMNLARLSPDKEYLAFHERLIRPLSARTAGPLISIDHVSKNPDGRVDSASGDRHKENAVTGASFGFEIVQHFGVGRIGLVRIMLHKDRPGGLRGHQGASKEVARLRLTSHPDHSITSELLAPPAATDAAGAPVSHWQPTGLMERVSRLLENSTTPLSRNAIESAVTGKRDYVRQALDCLVEEGYVEALAGANRAHTHRSIKPYREDPDPSDSGSPRVRPEFAPGEPDDVVPGSPPPALKGRGSPPSSEPLLDTGFAPTTGANSTHHLEAIRN